jgi:hypothetical protein
MSAENKSTISDLHSTICRIQNLKREEDMKVKILDKVIQALFCLSVFLEVYLAGDISKAYYMLFPEEQDPVDESEVLPKRRGRKKGSKNKKDVSVVSTTDTMPVESTESESLPKRRGRPKGSKNKKDASVTSTTDTKPVESTESESLPKRRGRKKGSKNKKNVSIESATDTKPVESTESTESESLPKRRGPKKGSKNKKNVSIASATDVESVEHVEYVRPTEHVEHVASETHERQKVVVNWLGKKNFTDKIKQKVVSDLIRWGLIFQFNEKVLKMDDFINRYIDEKSEEIPRPKHIREALGILCEEKQYKSIVFTEIPEVRYQYIGGYDR